MDILFIFLLLCFNIILCYKLTKYYNTIYVVRFFYMYYIIQIILSLIIVIIDHNFIVPGHPIRNIKISDITLKYSFIVTVIGISIIIGVKLTSTLHKYKCIGFYEKYIKINDISHINIISKIMSIIFCITILIAFIPTLPYILRVISLSFSFITLFIGIFYPKINNKKIWISLLIINFVVQNIQGSRGLALIPFVLFILGYLISIYKTTYFKKRIILFCILTIPLISLFGAVASFRELYGRGIDVNYENLSKMVNFVFSENKSSNDSDNFLYGLSRLINHGDFAIIGLTPNVIQHREWDSFTEEIKYTFTLHGEEGNKLYRTQRGNMNYGSGALAKYGFSINETTSTGLGLLGDSYSRFGILGVIIYYVMISIFLTAIEYKLSKTYYKNKISSYILFIFFIYTSLYTLYGNSYFVLLKKFLFNGSFVYICILSINILFSKRRKITSFRQY